MKNKEDLFWARVIEVTGNRYKKNVYDYFVADAQLVEVRENTAVIALDENKRVFWQENLQDIVVLAGMEVYDTPMQMEFVSPNIFSGENYTTKTEQQGLYHVEESVQSNTNLQILPPVQSDINPKFTFKNFIQGDGNKWAFVAAQAVTDKPGQTYNPLFIYGGPGLGKTHLLNAIGNEVLKNNPYARVKYVTTENFVNDFINHIRHDNMDDFKSKYRNLDVLLIDDIQSLSKKDGTIEEFFNTFNELHNKEKQIVLTSDRSPKDLNDLPERMVTRFEWGLPVPVSPPDYETRIAILTSKIEENDFDFTFRPEAIEYLASQFDSNVRELEGALNSIRIVANYQQSKEITIDLAAEAIRANRTETSPTTSLEIEQIQAEVSKFYGVTIKDIKGTKRPQNIVLARQVAMYLSRELTDNSLPKIGKAFGGRDHSTVLHACNKIKNVVTHDDTLKMEIETIKSNLRS